MNERYTLTKITTTEGLDIIKEYHEDLGFYYLSISENGASVYSNKLTKNKMKIYEEFIKARLDILLQENGKLSKPFNMFEIGRRMYRVCDCENRDHRKLTVECEPIGYDVEESITVDLLLDSTLYDVFTYEPNTLVYRFGHFYLNGSDLGYYLDVIFSLGFDIKDIDIDCGRNMDKLANSISRFVGYDIIGFVGESCDCAFEKKNVVASDNASLTDEITVQCIDINSMIKKQVAEKTTYDLENHICGDQKGTIVINTSSNPLNSLDVKELTKIISENVKAMDFRAYGKGV